MKIQGAGFRVPGSLLRVRRACLQHVGEFRAEPKLPHRVVELVALRLGALLSSEFFLCSGIRALLLPREVARPDRKYVLVMGARVFISLNVFGN